MARTQRHLTTLRLLRVVVGAIANTGILVGPTDASLFAASYLPAHAVLVELIPAGTRRTTFRFLSESTVRDAAAGDHPVAYDRSRL